MGEQKAFTSSAQTSVNQARHPRQRHLACDEECSRVAFHLKHTDDKMGQRGRTCVCVQSVSLWLGECTGWGG